MSSNVRPETLERVRRAVEVLGYSVNRQARPLAKGLADAQIILIHAHNPERRAQQLLQCRSRARGAARLFVIGL